MSALEEINENLDPVSVLGKLNIGLKEDKETQFKINVKPLSKVNSPFLLSKQTSEV